MFNHEPPGYKCPFCEIVSGIERKNNSQNDIVHQDSLITAFISPRWWPRNPGHVLIVANEHYENIYDLPSRYASRIHDVARDVAIAFKQTYNCDGVSTRQHNEPEGGQDVWHYHLHVFPRYKDDNLYQSTPSQEFMPADKRSIYAQRIREYLSSREHPHNPS